MKKGDYIEYEAPGPGGSLGRGVVTKILENGYLRITTRASGRYSTIHQDYVRKIPQRHTSDILLAPENQP